MNISAIEILGELYICVLLPIGTIGPLCSLLNLLKRSNRTKIDLFDQRLNRSSEVKEIILSTNSGQIGVLPNHAPIATAVDIGILRIRLNDQWVTMALMGGFARISNNKITILVNDAEKSSDIDPEEAKQTPEIAEANLSKAEGKRQLIEANLSLRRARTRVEAINMLSQ
ncbi:ATP synthase epsilon chain, chloroplastic-like [Arachis stenosperma]|uniref:ATP synthase epsilon chain, chloroplastic-like n=1 Tax=Arachis stenosperma TaxID=217475 RepID=UPI0025ABDE15|nr:ATP synthase epsilon chain, chloroplastic-like [Arachis stenosperma]